MNANQREKLLVLHRTAMATAEAYYMDAATVKDWVAADDAFRDFLLSLDVTK